MNPKIISLGYAVPQQRITQAEALEALGYKSPLTRRIFESTGIEKRHAWVDPRRLNAMSWQELTEQYEKGALTLSIESAYAALDGRGVEEIGQLTFVSVTGYTCPSLSYAIAGALGMRSDLVHSNLLGQGWLF